MGVTYGRLRHSCISKMQTEQETPDVESSTPEYARRFSGPVGEYFLDTQQSAIVQLLGQYDTLKVLDIGGGHAQLTPFLVHSGAVVTVLGSDESGRQQLDDVLGKKDYHYKVGNLLELPFADQSYDVVIAIRMLPHLVNWERFIMEMCRVAKTAVVVDYPDKRSVNYFSDALFAAKKKIEHNTRPYKCFSTRELEQPFEQAGFNPDETIRQFSLPMALHRGVGSRKFSAALEGIFAAIGIRRLFGSPAIKKFTRSNLQTAAADASIA